MNSYSAENWRETSKPILRRAKAPISLRRKHVISMCDDIFLWGEHTVLVDGGGCEAVESLAELSMPWHVFIRATRQAADSSSGLSGGALWFPCCQETLECPVVCPCHNVLQSISSDCGKKTLFTHTILQWQDNIIHDLILPDDGNVTTDYSLSLLSNCCYARFLFLHGSYGVYNNIGGRFTIMMNALPNNSDHSFSFLESDAKVSLLSTSSTTPDCL